MSIITTFESQCRALASTTSPDENASRFLVGTLSPTPNNLLYLFEYKDDNNNLAKVSFRFPYGELWHLSTSNKFPTLAAGVLGNRGELGVGLFRLPDEVKNSIEDDFGLSDAPIEKVAEFISDEKCQNLVRQSLWQPDDGCQLLTCNKGCMELWDIEQQKRVRTFSLLGAIEKYFNTETQNIKPAQICDLRWSSLFSCSVIAAAIGPRIYGIDTRISDSSSASICWLIEEPRCNRVRSIDFNPNSQYYIASGGDDCRATFWDLRRTSEASLNFQTHTHWIWSIRYNPFHDQLVLTAGGDARVALLRTLSVSSDPYGQLVNDDDDDFNDDLDSEKGPKEDKHNEAEDDLKSVHSLSGVNNSEELSEQVDSQIEQVDMQNGKAPKDEVIKVYEDHDDSVYAAEWATDPWIFASLGFESRLVIGRVPKAEKFKILF